MSGAALDWSETLRRLKSAQASRCVHGGCLYVVNDRALTVLIVTIGHRRDVYR